MVHLTGSSTGACRGNLTDYQSIVIAMQPLLDCPCSILGRMLQSALPDDGHAPAKSVEHRRMTPVALDISFEFVPPELLVGSGSGRVTTTFVSMPETAVDEHRRLVLREYKVGGSGQLSDMKPIPESSGKKKGPKCPFRPSILSANARHHPAALRSGRDAHGLGGISPRYLQKSPSHTSDSKPIERKQCARCPLWELSMRLMRKISRGGD